MGRRLLADEHEAAGFVYGVFGLVLVAVALAVGLLSGSGLIGVGAGLAGAVVAAMIADQVAGPK